tara:strand:+ start:203 stop:742 length:540 start_codon:yes stop_codon:yes gene_type:complete
MTRLQAGELVADFTLPSISGSMFSMSETRGRKVILTFFRFSSCPFCNIRISQLTKRWNEFSDDIIMVGIFDAKIDDLKKRMKHQNAPFSILADENYELFTKHSVQKSFVRFMLGTLSAPLTLLKATMRGYFPMTLSISKLSTIPVDILIDENGKVVKAHYCKNTADHLSIDEMVSFSNS